MATTSTGTSSARPTTSVSDLVKIQSTFLAIATLLVLLRAYVRTMIVKKFGLDDAFIVLALSLSIVVCVMTSTTIHYADTYLAQKYATKAEAIRLVTTALKWSSIAAPIGILSGLCTRISICLFLLRIFGAIEKWRWGLYSIMAFVTTVFIPTIVCLFAQCSPVQKQWDPSVPGHCWSPKTMIDIGYFNGATSVFSDWLLATLPIVFMWNVQMKVKTKVGICVLMGMGYFTGVCAIERTKLFSDGVSEAIHGGSNDPGIWAILEINIGMLAASIPTIKPLFNSSRLPFLHYIRFPKNSAQQHQTCEKTAGNQIRLHQLTLNTMPSTIPASFAYYQDRDTGAEDLESRASSEDSKVDGYLWRG